MISSLSHTHEEEKFSILDSECRRSVARTNRLDGTSLLLKSQGLNLVIGLVTESFEFGGGEVLSATRAFIYPVVVNSYAQPIY